MKEKYRIGVCLMADTINGVTICTPTEFRSNADNELLPPRIFFESLSTLDDSDVIYAFFDGNDSDIFDLINEKYGIN